MDTKSKNIKYKSGTKIAVAIVMWVSIVAMLASGSFILINMDDMGAKSYYDTPDFKMKISRLIHNVVELNTSLKDIDEDEVEVGNDIGINDEAVTENTAITEGTETEEVSEVTVAAERLNVAEWSKSTESAEITTEKITETATEDGTVSDESLDEKMAENAINEKLMRLAAINNNLSRAINFNYYAKDMKTGEVSSKLADGYNLEQIKEDPNHIYIGKNEIPYYLDYYGSIQEMLISSPYEVYVLISQPLQAGDEFFDGFNYYTQVKKLTSYAVGTLISSLVLLLISFGYLVFTSGRKEKGGEIYLAEIDRIYNDVQSLLVLIAAVFSVALVGNISYGSDMNNPGIIVIMIILAIDVAIGMTYLFSMLRQFRKGVLLKNTLIWKVFGGSLGFIRGCFSEKLFKPWLLGLMLLYALINGLLFSFTTQYLYSTFLFGSILIIIFNAGAVYLALKALKSLSIIMDAAKEISEGNLDYEISQSKISMAFSSFAQNIQSIQGGLKNAVNDAIKGERMKTDLITNVSHDLKTPLTSIINYVDLLKQEEIENEKATGYLNILDEKSDRLKKLIEDLIEASKASSGNLIITTEQVDLGELVSQACGEYEEKIQEAQLDIRINALDEKIWLLADGKYMWRILENMMSNVLKYSMANSRVYIHTEKNKGYGVLVMKNISAYPLDIDPAELTERFIRADESRTTEGSGLGLSIAQSLANIQGGRFNIEIDGDLFKVRVEIPLWVE